MLRHMPKSKASKDGRRRHVRLFRNGRNQAVRIPRELELPGQDAFLYREGERLVIEPLGQASLVALFSSWEPVDTDWPDIEDPVPHPVVLPD
jgi:antitoxin VapB